MKRLDHPLIEKIKLKCAPVVLYDCFKTLPYSFFLDSALPSAKLGRFSYIGFEPFLVFKSKNDRITIDRHNMRDTLTGNPFSILKRLLGEFKMERPGNLPFSFIGGGVGYFSYDLKNFTERLPDISTDDIGVPDCVMCFYDTVLAFDHAKEDFFIISSGFPEKGAKRLYRQKVRLESLKNRIRALGSLSTDFPAWKPVLTKKCGLTGSIIPQSNFTKKSYIKTVERAKEYIKAGDIYQVNLSQRFKFNLDMEAFDLYKILRTINPAPFASFLNFGKVKIASSSPERFLRKEGFLIQTRPIKGTRPRGWNLHEDTRLKNELIASAKDRAENLMIIDLERNDLGRICEYGSVRVTEFMTCEEYSTVFHLVSTVEGKLRKNTDAIDCLISCFPGGSITGAPKIRSMEIIEELEPSKRSVYTGSIGYIGFDGNMDTSIVIRTFIINGKEAYFQAGGGIVYDSRPLAEYEETLHKAKALLESIRFFNHVLSKENSIGIGHDYAGSIRK
ncbi:MAG: aminodeoxychorismate synthase component I [Candidatus Omnitrophica bacterium]|nr:aminodeoxychorismate synthase component I [Candidatus Omnitrophota bacterium]